MPCQKTQPQAQSPLQRLVLIVMACLAGFLFPSCTQNSSGSQPHPEEAQVRKAVDQYFASWSAQNMEAYAASFHPQARIFFIASGGQVISQPLGDFLHGQRMAHAQAREPMKEVPLSVRILMDDKGAQAHVTWLLTKGKTQEKGVDLFTFKREGKDWKIVSLVFYGE